MAKKAARKKTIDTITHTDDKRKNIPTAEHRSVLDQAQAAPRELRYPRNTDLDPQLVWRGKDERDWSDLVVQAPPLYIQEKVHPKVLIDDLLRSSRRAEQDAGGATLDLFADFNGIPEGVDKTEFYKHDQNWSNRMILGDSLQVMASLAEREGLRGKVQCIYFDPPYGIKFNSNFQWSTTSRDVKDGKADHITREPEQVKAFRDTWRDGIHSYLTYLRDRLTVARDLLTESGSIFLQISDQNVHRIRCLVEEVFGEDNFAGQIAFSKTTGQSGGAIPSVTDYLIWYARDIDKLKRRKVVVQKPAIDNPNERYVCVETERGEIIDLSYRQKLGEEDMPNGRVLKLTDTSSQTGSENSRIPFAFQGLVHTPSGSRGWSTSNDGLARVREGGYLFSVGKSLLWKNYRETIRTSPVNNSWLDLRPSGFGGQKIYVVETEDAVIARCLLMTTDPGDLVLDPTCGSGTTAYVAEQWGRRWITVDTSRVALALARARIMGARYPFYMLADSKDGLLKEAEVGGKPYVEKATYHNIRHGFVYERVPHITLKSIANNAEIDVLYEEYQPKVLGALARLNAALRGYKTPFRVSTGGRQGKEVKFDASAKAVFTMPSGETVPAFELVEWEVPREAPKDWPEAAHKPLEEFWKARIARQQAIDASIAAKAEFEFLYDRPYEDKKKVRVAGPFTVESLSPHRVLGVDEDDELIDPMVAKSATVEYGPGQSFEHMILENLKVAGVQQAHKTDRISFTSLHGWPGAFICAEGRYLEGEKERRAGIFIGPEFGTVSRPDLVDAAREAAEANFDVLITCAFNYEAHAQEFSKLGRIPVLKARMNADLHMAGDLKKSSTGNLFVIFGEPDIDLLSAGDDGEVGDMLRVKVNGVDVFDPSTGEVRSDGADGIACWFIDTDYNGESFFVRHAYFLGQNDPYKALKTTLRAEINAEAWETLNSDTSRPFPAPASGRIAVKVINHLGDEVMKVFRVG
jgi:adenine-specific DNA-methyltransferase